MVAGGAAPGGLDDQPAALRQEVRTRLRFELPPDRMRALHERRVGLALADCLAGDPRIAVGRTVDMRW